MKCFHLCDFTYTHWNDSIVPWIRPHSFAVDIHRQGFKNYNQFENVTISLFQFTHWTHAKNKKKTNSKSFRSRFFSYFIFIVFYFVVTERRYGCYRLGVLVAIIIVLLLILGTIPVTLTVKNNRILLICLCSTLGIVTILLSLFILWQHKQVKRQRERSTRPFILQKQNMVNWRNKNKKNSILWFKSFI